MIEIKTSEVSKISVNIKVWNDVSHERSWSLTGRQKTTEARSNLTLLHNKDILKILRDFTFSFKAFAFGNWMKLNGFIDLKVGGTPDFEWNFKSFKEGIEERKLFLKHWQTVDPHARAPQVVRELFGCPYTNF